MVKTRSRPVISKIFVMLRSLQTSDSSPSVVRSRLTPPTRTPSVVESMNVVSVKSTTTCFPPLPITSSSCALNSGAVYRSTSPASEITYRSPSSCSVVISKFTLRPPELLRICAVSPRRESLTLGGRAERLDLLARVGRVRIVGRELDECLVRRDRGRGVARVLGRLGEQQLVGRLGRLVQRRDLLVHALELLCGRLPRLERRVEALVGALTRGLRDRIGDRVQRPAERRVRGWPELGRLGVLRLGLGGGCLLGLVRELLVVIGRQRLEPVGVRRPQRGVGRPGRDRG